MKKTNLVIGLLVAAGAIWGGSTWYIGQQAKGHIDTSVNKINELLAKSYPNTKLSEVSYEKGFLSSTGIYKLVIAIPEFPELPKEISFQTKVFHGPLPLIQSGGFSPALAVTETTLLNDSNTKVLFDAANSQEPLVSKSVISFSNDIENTLKTAILKFSLPEGEGEIVIEPAVATTHTNTDYAFFNTEAMIGSLNAVGQNGELTIKADGFQLSNKTTRTANDNYIGDGTLKTGKFQATQKDELILIDSMEMTGTFSETANGLVNAEIDYAINKINVKNVDFGTTSIKMLVNNMDMKALEDFNKATASLNLSSTSPEEEAALEQHFKALFIKMADAKLGFSIEPLRIKGANGEAVVSFGVSFNGEKASSESRESMELFAAEALRKANFSISIDDSIIKEIGSGVVQVSEGADKATADSQAEVIAGMAGFMAEQSGMAVYKDGKTTSVVNYDASQPEDSQIDFNGKKMGLNEFAMTASSLLGFAGTSAGPAMLDEEALFQALENDDEVQEAEEAEEMHSHEIEPEQEPQGN